MGYMYLGKAILSIRIFYNTYHDSSLRPLPVAEMLKIIATTPVEAQLCTRTSAVATQVFNDS